LRVAAVAVDTVSMLWNDILCALCFSRRVNTVNDRKVGVSRDVVQGLGLGLNPGQRRVQGITAISILHPRSLFREMRRIDVLFSGLMGVMVLLTRPARCSNCEVPPLRAMTKASDPTLDLDAIRTKTSSKTVTQARHSAQQHEEEQMSLDSRLLESITAVQATT
jgi:hypothetical protein